MFLRLAAVFLGLGSLALVAIATSAVAGNSSEPSAPLTSAVLGPSGQPVPRFVALKRDDVIARFGPSFKYPVAYEFSRAGLPVKVIAEDRENLWRRVEDAEGRRMWIHRAMLTNNDHVIINGDGAVLRAAPRDDAHGRARLEGGVMAELETCADGWCRVRVETYRGWLPVAQLWGVEA